MGVAVVFDYYAWVAQFPQFASISPSLVAGPVLKYATQYCVNDGSGPVTDAETQTCLLNLMVAHICAILYGVNGNQPSELVGRITDATEGSVSVSADFPTTPNNAWFVQTPWGAMFYQMCAPYRTMRYVPGNCGSGFYGDYAGGRIR